MNTQFVKHKLPCPKCGSSDAVSLNNNGSAKCFSCNAFFPDYDNADNMSTNDNNIVPMKQPETSFLNSYTGVYSAISDRGISENTAKKFGDVIVSRVPETFNDISAELLSINA